MYLRVPWWVMYLFSCLYFLKQTSWLRLADASGLDFQCCFHHDLGPHQHCGSFNDPIHEETALSAGIHHHVTWRCVFDPGHRVLSFFSDMCQSIDVSSFPKKYSGLAPESLNSMPWVFSSRSLVPFGIAMRMRWWRRMAIQPREACCTPGRGKSGCFIVEAGIYLHSLWTSVDFVFLCFGREDAYDCHVFRKTLATIC